MKNLRFMVQPTTNTMNNIPPPVLPFNSEKPYTVTFSSEFDNENEAMIFAANMIKFITGNK